MITNASVENLEYYLNVKAQDDYYNKKDSNNKEGIGYWDGNGAKALGLVDTVEKQEFLRVMNGRNPHTNFSDKLSKYVRDDTKRFGQDFTFSANKSFSMLYNSVEDNSQLKQDLDKLWKEANGIVRSELESSLRIRENGKLVPISGAVIGYWEHETSRQENDKIDFNKHNHNVVSQYAIDSKGNWKSIDFKNAFESKKQIDAKAQAHIAKGLRQLGFDIVEGKNTWKIKGFPDEALKYFSGRRNKIVENAGENSSWKDRQKQADKKIAKGDYVLYELKSEWKSKLNDFGINPTSIELLRTTNKEIQKPVTKSDIIRMACGMAKSKHFKKEHILMALEKKSETHDFDKQKLYDEIFKSRDTFKSPVHSKSQHFYDRKFSGEKFHNLNQRIDKEFQSNKIAKLKSGCVKPSKEVISLERQKISNHPEKQVPTDSSQKQSPSSKQPAMKGDSSQMPSSGSSGKSSGPSTTPIRSAGYTVQQQIDSLLGSLHEARLACGRIDISSPAFGEQMAKIYAIEQQIASLAVQKGIAEYQEEQQKQASERQQEQQLERTR